MTETTLLPDGAGKRALVTGAAGGIGRAVVALFRASGVAVTASDLQGLDPAAEDYTPIEADCTDEAAVAALAGAAGPVDFVVHAVGVTGTGPLQDVTLADWQAMLDVNLTSAFLVTKAVYPNLAKPGGSVVLFSSTNGRIGGTRFSGPGYGAAKAGIINLVRYLAKEWAPEGLRANCIAPGPVDTPMLDRLNPEEHAALKAGIPLGHYTSAGQIAAAVAFLCGAHGSTMTGTVMNLSGGLVLD